MFTSFLQEENNYKDRASGNYKKKRQLKLDHTPIGDVYCLQLYSLTVQCILLHYTGMNSPCITTSRNTKHCIKEIYLNTVATIVASVYVHVLHVPLVLPFSCLLMRDSASLLFVTGKRISLRRGSRCFSLRNLKKSLRGSDILPRCFPVVL